MFHNKLKKYLINLFLEVPAVLIAVLLALVATEKAEDLSKKKDAELVLESITQEIQSNYGRLLYMDSITSDMINHNNKQIQLFRKDSIKNIPTKWATAEISNVAWEMAKYSELFSVIDSKILKKLGSIYQEQNRVYAIYNNYDLLVINRDTKLSNLDFCIKTTNHLKSLSSRYSDLIGRFERFLEV